MLGNLADIVRDRYRLASEVHGDLGVDIDEYQTHLERISDRYLGAQRNVEAEALFVQSLHTNDLLLTLACAKGKDAGWRRFHTKYRKYLSDLSRHLLGGSPDREELGETIWIDLFLPDKSGNSRIASYDGRSSLATWLRVVVGNRVINVRQRRIVSTGNIDTVPEPMDPSAVQRIESRLGAGRYHAMILGAFERALSGLNHREALIVLMRYDQGLQLGAIARLFDVHQSTITRQLERVVERLRERVTSLLASEYGLDGAQIDECLSVACETFATSVSILGFLKRRAGEGGSSSHGVQGVHLKHSFGHN
jgi:RNA polymerase sigma-70 factor (ECF subfamily)